MQLDMNELILQAPLSLGAVWSKPSGLRGCDIYQKKRVVFLVMDGFGKCGLFVFFGLGCEPDSVHVQETKPREEPPVFEQSG